MLCRFCKFLGYLALSLWIQCCECGTFIPDPNFFHPGSVSKNLSILTKMALETMTLPCWSTAPAPHWNARACALGNLSTTIVSDRRVVSILQIFRLFGSESNVADSGCLCRIPDPNFINPDPGSEFFPSRIRIKDFKNFNPKNWFEALENVIRVFIPDLNPDF